MYNACTTKIMRADKKISAGGKIEHEVIYVELKPSTANLTYIQSQIQKIWGNEYIVVSNDGLQIHDSPATRGKSSLSIIIIIKTVTARQTEIYVSVFNCATI